VIEYDEMLMDVDALSFLGIAGDAVDRLAHRLTAYLREREDERSHSKNR
jgi:hypothetical protein